MPFKDPEKKRQHMKKWREESIAKGYGKWLYSRRKLRFDDAERFRTAIEGAIDALQSKRKGAAARAKDILAEALRESIEAEEKLGEFTPKEKEKA